MQWSGLTCSGHICSGDGVWDLHFAPFSDWHLPHLIYNHMYEPYIYMHSATRMMYVVSYVTTSKDWIWCSASNIQAICWHPYLGEIGSPNTNGQIIFKIWKETSRRMLNIASSMTHDASSSMSLRVYISWSLNPKFQDNLFRDMWSNLSHHCGVNGGINNIGTN